jgi:hypothetical protein
MPLIIDYSSRLRHNQAKEVMGTPPLRGHSEQAQIW